MIHGKQLSLCLLAVALIALTAVPALADPLESGLVSVGDRYAVTTIHGQAGAWVSGSWVVSTADLQLVAQVTFVGSRNVLFRIVSGTIQLDDKVYSIVAAGWRGYYNRDTNTCAYQGPATAPDGQRAFFVIHGRDTLPVQQGTYMHMWSDFRDENGILWRIDLHTYRFKIN